MISSAFMLLLSGMLFSLRLGNGSGSFPRTLSAAEERQYVEAWVERGDLEARNMLIEHNLRLVAHIAKKYRRASCDAEDLVSIGSIGLIKAVHTFKPESGRLTAYASRCIENEILMYLRANRKNRNTVVMSESLSRDPEGNEISILDLLGTDAELVPDEVASRLDAGRALKLIDEVLTEREASVIRLRYGLRDGVARPQHEVGKVLGISRSYVSRIEKKALNVLKNAME